MRSGRRVHQGATSHDIVAGDEYRGVTFDHRDLRRRCSRNSSFRSCSFKDADLANVRLNAAHLIACDFSGAHLAGANLFSARFEDCKLTGVRFEEWDEGSRRNVSRLPAQLLRLSGR